MAQQFVDPDGDLVAEGGGHGVLAVGAPGDRHLRASSARSAIASRISPISRRKMPCAWRSTSRSPVWVMFCVVAPQWTQPPCGSPTTRPSSQTSGTMVWPVRAKPSSMRARSAGQVGGRGDRVGRYGGDDAEFGLRAGSATSTSSQACQRFSNWYSARIPDRRPGWRWGVCRSWPSPVELRRPYGRRPGRARAASGRRPSRVGLALTGCGGGRRRRCGGFLVALGFFASRRPLSRFLATARLLLVRRQYRDRRG